MVRGSSTLFSVNFAQVLFCFIPANFCNYLDSSGKNMVPNTLDSVITQVQQTSVPNAGASVKARYQQFSKRLDQHRQSSVGGGVRKAGGGGGGGNDSEQEKLTATTPDSDTSIIVPSSTETLTTMEDGSISVSVASTGHPKNRIAALCSTIFACCVPALRTLGLSKRSTVEPKVKSISLGGTPNILSTSVDTTGGNRVEDAIESANVTQYVWSSLSCFMYH